MYSNQTSTVFISDYMGSEQKKITADWEKCQQ
jgi:hypothetical protein